MKAHVAPEQPDADGIACAIEQDETSVHVLLADLGARNAGASVTNCAEFAVRYVMLSQGWSEEVARRATWVELDSSGRVDRIEPTFDRPGQLPALRWTPVCAADAEPRTLEAYLAAYGGAGARSLDRLAVAGLLPGAARGSEHRGKENER